MQERSRPPVTRFRSRTTSRPRAPWGQPRDVARAARGDLGYSTGTHIDVSGGFNLRKL